ncbi:hypothetical protein SSX86_012292 [Deinandra increscens subsp. villosa]|uniref:Uncharacterized protein n=1 Tax=Deinandra increscens subsp. villosa TaxID=3103831 RepID=A0AAP0D5L7_9ASTR
MADESAKSRRQPSRLQRRAPASIQVTPASQWNAAIPLLSPLIVSPDVNRICVVNSENKVVPLPEPEKGPIVYKKWQHPAAPFFYEPAPSMLQSICSGSVDRS